MLTHDLETDSDVFQALIARLRKFEIRKDNRGFSVGDVLRLRETHSTGEEMAAGAPLKYTGREALISVTHILRGPIYGLKKGWVIMSVD